MITKVAQQMVDGLDDVVTKAQQVPLLQNQLDSLVLSNGDSSAEVIQARTGYDGTSHPTLKDRLNYEAVPQSKQDEWDKFVEKPTWIIPTMKNGWESRGGLAFSKKSDGTIIFKGGLRGGTLGLPAFTLPVGYRPEQTRIAVVPDSTPNGTLFVLSVAGNGDVSLSRTTGTGMLAYLDGLSFFDMAAN